MAMHIDRSHSFSNGNSSINTAFVSEHLDGLPVFIISNIITGDKTFPTVGVFLCIKFL